VSLFFCFFSAIASAPTSYITKHEGPMEKAFVAQLPDMAGLPTLLRFDDFKMEGQGGHKRTSNGDRERERDRERHSKKKEKRKREKEEAKQKKHSNKHKDKHKNDSHKSDSHKHSSNKKSRSSTSDSSSSTSAFSKFVASLLVSRKVDPSCRKMILKKATEKIVQDWNSKPR
jgi:hypothetical protein